MTSHTYLCVVILRSYPLPPIIFVGLKPKHGYIRAQRASVTAASIGEILQMNLKKLKIFIYRQISNIRRSNSQNFNVCRLALQLSLPNPLKPGIKSEMKM